ncbi:uncharacterized protein LOC127286420 [Leptopilina boulardi]|uniref:uncharacterized protein LOC127286420 n=1 Tax=Leptopilina boulardi TaxID=63433 RepID=UPI0021F5F422|nr:uncharacterized protein LOC127286420 [Leptopilina boulardi]
MDNYSQQRYDTKIESFDSCMIETNQQQEIAQTVNTTSQQGQIENEENHEAGTLPPQQSQHIQNQSPLVQNAQQHMTLTPVRLPAILDGEFFSVIRLEDTNVTVRCLQCQKLLNGNLKSTGNFLSHIKRVHPFMVDKIKCKSNQRRPAVIYIDLSAERCPEIVRAKRGYRKYYKMEDCQQVNEETPNFEQTPEWTEPSIVRRRKSEEPESSEVMKVSHNNSLMIEDEFDAIGRNVAAKLRNMRLDQRIIAEKLLNDILFEAQLGNLHRDSNIHV